MLYENHKKTKTYIPGCQLPCQSQHARRVSAPHLILNYIHAERHLPRTGLSWYQLSNEKTSARICWSQFRHGATMSGRLTSSLSNKPEVWPNFLAEKEKMAA